MKEKMMKKKAWRIQVKLDCMNMKQHPYTYKTKGALENSIKMYKCRRNENIMPSRNYK